MASRDERHTTGRTKRGSAARDRQLGRVQRKVLVWLLRETHKIIGDALEADEIETGKLRDVRRRSPEDSAAWCARARDRRRALDTRGVPWRSVAEKLEERPSAVTEALAALESPKRRLVTVTRNRSARATHAKLTSLGERAATELKVEADAIPEWMQAAFERTYGPRSAWTREVEREFEDTVRELIAERETPFYDLPPIEVPVFIDGRLATVLDGAPDWTGKGMGAEQRKKLDTWLRAARKYARNKPEP